MSQALAFVPLRRAACALSAGPARATGWLASSRGLFATSHAALGYRLDVEIEAESGERRAGRVVFADVSRDLAFVLAEGGPARGGEAAAPLMLRDAPPARIGDRVFLVAALSGRGLRISPALVCAAPRSAGPSERIDTDAALVGPAGGPLIDAEGRAVGSLVRPAPGAERRAMALPATEIREALRALEAAPDLARRAPVYRCPACGDPFPPEHDACLACGAPLPHPFPPNPARAAAERMVRDALAAVGVVANRARTGPRSWHVPARGNPSSEPLPITLTLDERGATLALRAPLSLVPKASREPFYRLLLTLNDQATGPFRLAVAGDRVALVAAQPLAMVRERDFGPTLTGLCEAAEHFRKLFLEGHGAPPLAALDEPAAW